jgi:hypothetical protein
MKNEEIMKVFGIALDIAQGPDGRAKGNRP